MPARTARLVATAAVVLVAGLAGGLAVDGAQTSNPGQDAQLVTTADAGVPTAKVAPPTSSDAVTNLTTTTETTATVPGVVGTLPTTTKTVAPATVTGVAVGSAQRADIADKRREARASCRARPAVTSPLLGAISRVPGKDGGLPAWLLPAIALVAGALAIGLIAWRLRGKGRPEGAPKGPLEIISSTVAILGTLATLGVAYFGAGTKDRPPAGVSMKVREVHSRVTHGAFARKVPETERLSVLDRREIGNVVWLELRFTSLADTDFTLLAAAFGPGPGQPLIPDTRREIPIHVEDAGDVYTEFRPIWIGSPRVPRFRAEFRIIDADDKVRQIASTGPMKGIAYRYTC